MAWNALGLHGLSSIWAPKRALQFEKNEIPCGFRTRVTWTVRPVRPVRHGHCMSRDLDVQEIDQFLREQRLEDLHRKIQAWLSLIFLAPCECSSCEKPCYTILHHLFYHVTPYVTHCYTLTYLDRSAFCFHETMTCTIHRAQGLSHKTRMNDAGHPGYLRPSMSHNQSKQIKSNQNMLIASDHYKTGPQKDRRRNR